MRAPSGEANACTAPTLLGFVAPVLLRAPRYGQRSVPQTGRGVPGGTDAARSICTFAGMSGGVSLWKYQPFSTSPKEPISAMRFCAML